MANEMQSKRECSWAANKMTFDCPWMHEWLRCRLRDILKYAAMPAMSFSASISRRCSLMQKFQNGLQRMRFDA